MHDSKPINSLRPCIFGMDIFVSLEQDQHKGIDVFRALSALAEGILLSNVYTEACAKVCSQVFHDFTFKSL